MTTKATSSSQKKKIEKLTKSFIKKYRPALKELAKK
jgi:hypothetical protein